MPKKVVSKTPVYNLSNSQMEKDSLVFSAIMAGAKGKTLKPLQRGLSGMETPSSMCALGAGLRGMRMTRPSDIISKSYEKLHGKGVSSRIQHRAIPLVRFAWAMQVSENYACGINDGFENGEAAKAFYPHVNTKSLDYERGWHVGQAVAIEAGF